MNRLVLACYLSYLLACDAIAMIGTNGHRKLSLVTFGNELIKFDHASQIDSDLFKMKRVFMAISFCIIFILL